MQKLSPGIYAIIDGPKVSLDRLCEKILRLNPSAIQFRLKSLTADDRIRFIQKWLPQLKKFSIYINDTIELAHKFQTGLHLGQEDATIEEARNVLGQASIGISTHTLDQAIDAQERGADYIGFGPLFETTGKKNPLSPRPTSDLVEVIKRVSIPIVGIGGITQDKIPGLKKLGLDHFAMISGLHAL